MRRIFAFFVVCLFSFGSSSAQNLLEDVRRVIQTIPGSIGPFDEDSGDPDLPREIYEPLRLYTGLDMQERFNGYFDHERDYAPEASENCGPRYMPNACGRVIWGANEQPPLDVVFTASVPSIVRLDGPKGDVWWAPYVHCMIVNEMKHRYSASLPGTHCDTRLSRDGEEMEWTLGGFAEGMNAEVPGTYTGVIPMTVIGASYRWEVDIPITYIVHKTQSSCDVSIASNNPNPIDFGAIEEGGDAPASVSWSATIRGDDIARASVRTSPDWVDGDFTIVVSTPTLDRSTGVVTVDVKPGDGVSSLSARLAAYTSRSVSLNVSCGI